MPFPWFDRHARRRRDLLAQAPPGPVHDLLATPPPRGDTPLTDLPLLAIDLETTGLDPDRDQILSVGFVPVDGRSIRLGGAAHAIIHADASVGRSATIHGITDDAVAAGLPLADVLERTLDALTGRVLLAHFARIEVDFLTRACERTFGTTPMFTVVDTLALGQQHLFRTRGAIPRGQLRLHALRERFGLPRYKAHDALVDALACAELYLALTAERGQRHLRQVRDR